MEPEPPVKDQRSTEDPSQEPVEESRVELLEELCDLWIEHTNCSLNEIVSVINDPQEA